MTWFTFVPQTLYPASGHCCLRCGESIAPDVITLVLVADREVIGHVGFCCCDAGARRRLEEAAQAERRRLQQRGEMAAQMTRGYYGDAEHPRRVLDTGDGPATRKGWTE
jgi:hypothetical protein